MKIAKCKMKDPAIPAGGSRPRGPLVLCPFTTILLQMIRRFLRGTILLALVCAGAGPTSAPTFDDAAAAAHGMATLELIRQRMTLPDGSGLFAQEIHPADPSFKLTGADCWSAGVQLTALTAAARLDPQKYQPQVRRLVDALNEHYWSDTNGIGGYDDGPHPKPPDRYYDDNAWVVLGLIEAYEVGHDPKDLDRASATLRYVLSGEDDQLGGGLYWRELAKESKNTCSNAPGIAAALRVYTYTHDRSQLDAAIRLYRWTVKHLRDDRDYLYYDNLTLAGHLSDKKWSYNTALMIRSGCLLYDVTGDATYLHDAEHSAASAVAKWVDPATGTFADPSYFAHLLADALLDLSARDHDPRWAAIDHQAIAWVWANLRDPAGFFPERWGRRLHGPVRIARLINQASAARAFLRAAWPDAPPSPAH
jgi:hypothetical protein